MNNYLIDTCIWIDLFRKDPKAIRFFESLESNPVISLLIMAELYAGARDQYEKKLIAGLEQHCIVAPFSMKVAEVGGEFRSQYHKSHGTGLIDALLAASVKETGSVFVTLNLKHFPMLKKTELLRPY